jgi:carboxypeptidase Taq
MEPGLEELKKRLGEVYDLRYAANLLRWDEATYMPPGGVVARGRQLATLDRLAHERFTDPAMGELLEGLRSYEEELPYDSDEAALIRVTSREYGRAARKPPGFVARLAEHSSASYHAWKGARPDDDFATMRSYLEETLDLSRELSSFFPESEHVADPLIAEADPGMNAASVRAVFSELREVLVPLVEEISERAPLDDSFLRQPFDDAEQLAFAEAVIRRFGYDFARGRQDLTAHPFMVRLSWGDVRITTRFKDDDLRKPLFTTMHEAGHALYEQGVSRNLDGTPLGEVIYHGVHESQSRLWENVVGRSLPFWAFFYPRLQERFPGQLGSVSLDEFYRAVNKVEPSLIRTDADEVTYDLHVILRFDFELALLEGSLEVRNLPEAWGERMKSDLGVVPPDDRDGVLQDSHWYSYTIGGMFQGYTLGNIMGAQFYRAALAADPGIPDEMRSGEFGALRGWLTENVYRHGSKYGEPEILERATGSPLTVGPYADYLRAKYGEIYGLP